MLKKILILGISTIALSGCAHSPLKAPCGAVKVAANGSGDCDPKPINYAALQSYNSIK